MLPWQAAANAQQFGLDAQQQHKKMILFGTDGTNSPVAVQDPGQLRLELRSRHLDVEPTRWTSRSSTGVAKYGPYGAFGVPTYAATDVVMKAIASVCKTGADAEPRPTCWRRSRRRTSPPRDNPLGVPISFTSNGDLVGQPGYLFHDQQPRASTSRSRPSRSITSAVTHRRQARGAARVRVGGAGALDRQPAADAHADLHPDDRQRARRRAACTR